MRTKKLFPILLVWLLLSSCKAGVTIQDVEICTAAGSLRNGADCAHLISSATSELTMEGYFDMLEPTQLRPGALCMSASDFGKMKTSLEIACQLLGKRCSRQAIDSMAAASYTLYDLTEK